jgi:quercetin dioxygenase-like cupin family protein
VSALGRSLLVQHIEREAAVLTTTINVPEERQRNRGRRDTGTDGRRWSPLVIAVVGLALTGLSARTLASTLSDDGIGADANPHAPVATSLIADVKTADLVYEPGHSSGWHVHAGVHAVVVLSGKLTVYDESCRRQDYEAGRTYVGGREPHLARNRTAEDLRLAVTYVADSPSGTPGSVVSAPKDCEAAE